MYPQTYLLIEWNKLNYQKGHINTVKGPIPSVVTLMTFPPSPLTITTHPSEKNISWFHSLVSMSLTTIRQMASCLLWARDTFGMALKHTAHIIIPLPDLGIICYWKMCLFGSQKMKHSRKKCFKNGFESNRSKPQIWSACTWHHSRWSLCVCVCMYVWPAWVNQSMWMQLECICLQLPQLCISAACCSQSPPRLKYCLLSFLSACLCWRPQGRNIFQGTYVWMHTC